ncbi:MAG: hypothetical protein QOH84_6663 [Kribbellaceae bacterium]|jgi:hypothetical protein|nr:hypothetical protein [Kribbellaceae bacterium]
MTDLHHHPIPAGRRRKSVSAPVQKSGAMSVATPVRATNARPESVQVKLGGRWIAGQALAQRSGEVLVSHHGHLVWVDQQSVRKP